MDDIVCEKCGAPWPAGQIRCECGGTARQQFGSALFKGKGNFQATANLLSTVSTIWEKNWPVIISYLLVQFLFAAVSYWTSGWFSVGWSFLGSVISTVLGLFIITKVITKLMK
jgi:hypothetical protein